MSTIKDLVDLTIKLRDERRESWVAPIVAQFQQITQKLQMEHSDIISENLDLKRKIFQMEQAHAKAIAEQDAKITKLQSDASDGSGIIVIGKKSIFADDSEPEA
jgi:hypothetical protein